jgi:hypothetical protein
MTACSYRKAKAETRLQTLRRLCMDRCGHRQTPNRQRGRDQGLRLGPYPGRHTTIEQDLSRVSNQMVVSEMETHTVHKRL